MATPSLEDNAFGPTCASKHTNHIRTMILIFVPLFPLKGAAGGGGV